jgi:serine/threonine protein phosphatase PrpC
MFGQKRASESEAEETRQREAPRAFEIDASVQTDKGRVREINEDSGRLVRPADPALLATKGLLVVVADGMGGHSAGEVASQMAADIVSRLYYETRAEPGQALRRSVEEANRRIHEAAAEDAAKHGMGTTCTALALCGGRAYVAHVGDSRLYMLRDGRPLGRQRDGEARAHHKGAGAHARR